MMMVIGHQKLLGELLGSLQAPGGAVVTVIRTRRMLAEHQSIFPSPILGAQLLIQPQLPTAVAPLLGRCGKQGGL